MKAWLQFKSIRKRQTFWLLLVSVIPLLFFCIIVYNQRVQSIKEEGFLKLTTIRDLKVQQINEWLDERIGDVHTVAEDYDIKSTENLLNK